MDNTKQVAAMTAVLTYMRTQEEAAAMSAPPEDETPAITPVPPMNLWGQSGRQAQMQMRTLIQMKTFHR